MGRPGEWRQAPNRSVAMVRGGTRGVIAAMAMTGLRSVTTAAGLVAQTPPEAIVQQEAPRLLAGFTPARQRATVETLHWTYGAMGGAAFGLLPREARRRAWVGPLYGLAVWAMFEVGLAPLLGLTRAHERRTTERVTLLMDHMLYGIIVAASPWPHRD